MPQKTWSAAPSKAKMTVAVALILLGSAWAAPKYKVLHAFTGGADGGGLWSSLLLDKQGDVYGTTSGNTAFKLMSHANGKWSLKVLHTFGEGNDGSGLIGGLIFDAEGDLYGTTVFGGGPYRYGTVFELTAGSDGWKETVLHRFGFNSHGCCPQASLVMDNAGNLFGTASVAFELSPGADGWKETVLHDFTGEHGDGEGAYAGLTMGAAGNLYGTTEYGGGSQNCDGGCGTVYQLSPTSGGKWKETILHRFQAHWDGSYPGIGALILDDAGNVYGTADGGNSGYGVVFKLAPAHSGGWKETVLYNIAGGAEGAEPTAGVVMDNAGNLYGTTNAGGTGCGCGVVYKLSLGAKGKWTYTVLHAFAGYDGAGPTANLILDSKGNLYGTTATGGTGGYGVAFELTP